MSVVHYFSVYFFWTHWYSFFFKMFLRYCYFLHSQTLKFMFCHLRIIHLKSNGPIILVAVRSAAACWLGLWFEFRWKHGFPPFVFVACRVGSRWSLVQSSPTACLYVCLTVCDAETPRVRQPRPCLHYCATEKRQHRISGSCWWHSFIY